MKTVFLIKKFTVDCSIFLTDITNSIMQLLTELKKSYLSYECSAPFYVSGLAVLLFH